ncbi:MAG: YihY/virulence factor BrkB family protein [Actinomycetes bacterium]
MTSVTPVPETRAMRGDELSAEDAWGVLRVHGGWRLARDSFVRMRDADGFAYSRAVGLQISLAIIPLVVALLGLSRFVGGEPGRVLDLTIHDVTPGASDRLLESTASGSESGGMLALALGLLGCVVALTGAMAEVERGANRLYGSAEDRDTRPRYARALLLALTAGVPCLLGWLVMVGGEAVGDAVRGVYAWGGFAEWVWDAGRWPAGLLCAVAGFAVLFNRAPRRDQPSVSWLVFGGATTVSLWLVFTIALATYVETSGMFGRTYGPLTGVVALLLWAYLSSVALFLGLSFTAQMEAVHSGRTALVPGDG